MKGIKCSLAQSENVTEFKNKTLELILNVKEKGPLLEDHDHLSEVTEILVMLS